MSRYDHAKHMALTSEYWAAYMDGIRDRHNIRDNDDAANHAELNRLLQARLDRYEAEEARRARREPWDNDWEPVAKVENPANLDVR